MFLVSWLALATALPNAQAADDWYPLAVGNQWHFTSPTDPPYTQIITGTRVLLGRTVFVRRNVGGHDDGIESYWLTAEDGSLLLAGFNSPNAPVGPYVYDPPLRVFQVPPALGLAWTSHATVYSSLGPLGPVGVSMQVLGTEVLAVPAGSFATFAVGQAVQASDMLAAATMQGGRSFAIDGRAFPQGELAPAILVTEWYSAGVGVVQSDAGYLRQLAGIDGPTATGRSSWGRIKRLYLDSR